MFFHIKIGIKIISDVVVEDARFGVAVVDVVVIVPVRGRPILVTRGRNKMQRFCWTWRSPFLAHIALFFLIIFILFIRLFLLMFFLPFFLLLLLWQCR